MKIVYIVHSVYLFGNSDKAYTVAVFSKEKDAANYCNEQTDHSFCYYYEEMVVDGELN